MVMKSNNMTDYENNLYKKLKSGKLEVRVSYRTFLCPYCPKQKVGLYIDILQHASGVGNSSSKKRSLTEKACHRALAKYLRKDLADYATATVSRRSKALASLTGDIPLAYDDQFEKLVWPWKGILVNIPTKMGHDGLCCTGESGPQLKDELIRRGFNPIRVRTVWDCFGHSGTGIVEFNRDWNGLNDALLFKKAYQEDGHGKKDWLSSGGGAADSSLYAWLANADDYYRANYIGEYLRKMGDLKSVSRFAEEEARKDHKLVQRLNLISENIQSQLRMLEEKFSKTSIALKCETEEKDKILHGYNQDLTGRQQRSTDHFNRIFADHEKQKAQLETQMKELQIRESVLAKRDAENETQRKVIAKELEQSAAKYSYVQLVAVEQQKTREKVKKMAVDHKMQKEKLRERITALERELGQKQDLELEVEHLKRQLSVMRHMELDTRREKASLNNISSHGIYVLDSSFDRAENDGVLDFLGLKQVSNEWYAKCIQGCDLVRSVSEDTYVEVLLFVAENWQSMFQGTNMVKVPILKYVVRKGVTYLSSLSDFSPRTLCFPTVKNQEWLLDWSDEFRCMSNFVFMPQPTLVVLRACSKKDTVLNWFKGKIKVTTLSFSDYTKRLLENLGGDKRLVLAYAHFLHHSISRKFLTEDEGVKCCKDMPLVDNYGNVNTSRTGVLVPASQGKWISLTGSNPWRQDGYIELWEEYLSSGRFAGVLSSHKALLPFLKYYANAGDVPEITPPNAAIPALSGALRKENALLLLKWIQSNRYSLPSKFMDSVKGGSWLRTTMNGSSDYRPPCQSFYHTSSWGSILQGGSILVDIPLVDRSFYGKEIESYKEELKVAGVMFEFSQACEFVGDHLMRLAETSSLSRENVFSILKFIRYLGEKLLSPADFIRAVQKGSWLKTATGYRSPDGAVLYSQEWKAASLISDIPFIDKDCYGEANLKGFEKELELLGVVVQFSNNHSLIVSHLNASKLNYLTAEAMLLVLDCMRYLSPRKLISLLRISQCFKTKNGYKTPAECFIPDPEWSCLVSVFDCFPLIDESFYGSKIFSYKEELNQIGVVVQLEEAVKGFVRTFKQKATSSSCLNRDTSMSLLSCYKKLMESSHKFPEELMKSFKELQWLHTTLGDFRAPKDCILFEQDWEHLRLVANLPFINDSSNWYGKSIYGYKNDLKSLGVTVEMRQGMGHVGNSLSLPDPSRITPLSAISLLKCVTFLLEEDRFGKLPNEFLDKVSSVKWLKTHAGYRRPEECLLFDNTWELERCDGPFIDEEYYGTELKGFKKELVAIGVGNDSAKACRLLATHVYNHSDSDAISKIYRFLSKSEWRPERGSASAGRIWIPSECKWADVSSCVVYDKDKLFGTKLNVLENHYDSRLLDFFSSAFEVRASPSVEDYCALWKDWERTKERLSYDECCAFWRFVARHSYTTKADKFLSESISRLPVNTPDFSNSGGILLCDKSDVFVADDLLLKDLFTESPVFVWYPSPSIPTLSQTKLTEIYRKLGVKEISKCVEMSEAKLTDDGVKTEQGENHLIGRGLVRLILGFLSDPSLKIEAEERSEIIQGLVTLNVLETPETISTEYTLNLPSKGEKLVAKAKRMIRWEREKGIVYAEKMEKACVKRKVLEYATCFAEVIAKGAMWQREELIGGLSELVKMAYLVEFDEEALEFLMKSKNLQVYEEDEKLISDAYPLNKT